MSGLLAMDLAARELRVVEAQGRRLVRHAEFLLADGSLVDGIPGPWLSESIQDVLRSSGFSSTRARVAIPEAGTASRDFRLPRLPAGLLADAVRFEGRRLIPMAADDVYFAWHAVRDRDGYAVYLVAARREPIDTITAALQAAGLQVERIDLKPLALARGIRASEGLVLEWATADATLVLMAEGRPRFFRTFQLDAPTDDPGAQLDELALAVAALVKFMRGAASQVSIGPSTTLALAGRFGLVPDGLRMAEERFDFRVTLPQAAVQVVAGLPLSMHFAALGLLQNPGWRSRLTPTQGGDIRVAA